MMDSKCNSAADCSPPSHIPHEGIGSAAALPLVLASKYHKRPSCLMVQSMLVALGRRLGSIQNLVVAVLRQGHCMAARIELHSRYKMMLAAREVLHGEETLMAEGCCQ
jgi:hypothetical protein